ncbi:MAG: spirocyclase AveC family protein [Zavarzinia sp.]|nr:spirocyclase AveC family protein [Zavarzinia sp.]
MDATYPVSRATTRPILWWAALGAVFAAFQLYLFGAWILSPGFAPVDPGADAITDLGRIVMWGVALSFCSMAAAGLAWILVDLARGRALNIVQLLMIGCAFCLWQDPTVNLLRPVAMYNTHYPNMGSWAEQIPWWFSPNGARNAQPLTFQSALYPVMVPVWVITAWAVMVGARRRWPRLGGPWLALLASAAITIGQTGAEVAMVRGEIFAYGGVIESLTVFPGTRWQFPVYGAFLWSIGTVALACLMFWRDVEGRTVVERGIETLAPGTGTANLLRALAFIGAANLAILAYYLPFQFVSLYSDPWPDVFPSYFLNGVCGEGTGYACPDPVLPVPGPHVPPS